MLNSIEPHIGFSCIYLLSVKDIWDHLRHMYSGIGNIARFLGLSKVLRLWMSTTIRS